MTRTTRRQVVRTLVGTVSLSALAGCGDGGTGNGGDGGDGEDTPTETDAPTPTLSPTPTPEPQAETVLVGPDTQNVFEPDSLEVASGTVVTFVWESGGHSLVVDSQPDGADWAGVSETQSEGYEHSHTFEVPGTYEYHCGPHEAFGMVGSLTVTE